MKTAILIFTLLIVTLASEVSYSNLKAFWQNTYDPDGDGRASIHDFVEYFR